MFPTVASANASSTALTTIYKESGEFSHYLYLTQNPDLVIVDTSIIAEAPLSSFAAGVGSISNLF